jgi:RNA polymerase sigma-70 factor (ECF subfamily)
VTSGAAADPEGWDRALLQRIGTGDRRALEELYRRHAGWLVVRLQRRCGDGELVDSALQDTFLAVWRSPGTYRGEGDVGAWLWGIAVRRLIDQQRRRRPDPVDHATIEQVGAGPVPVGGGTAAGEPHHPSAERAMLDATLAGGDVADALAALPDDLRDVLLVTAVDGLTTAEAGLLLGIPQGTVKTRLMRARAILQERMR